MIVLEINHFVCDASHKVEPLKGAKRNNLNQLEHTEYLLSDWSAATRAPSRRPEWAAESFFILEDINRSSSRQQCVTWTLSMVLISFRSLCPLSSSPPPPTSSSLMNDALPLLFPLMTHECADCRFFCRTSGPSSLCGRTGDVKHLNKCLTTGGDVQGLWLTHLPPRHHVLHHNPLT